jgi:hypothetical protein
MTAKACLKYDDNVFGPIIIHINFFGGYKSS